MDDQQIWNLFRQGDQQAFQQIFEQYIKLLYKYGSRFTTDAALVEDCIQDLFLYLWQKRNSVGETDNIKFYLLAALRRHIVRKLKTSTMASKSIDSENYNFELEFNIEENLIREENESTQLQRLNQAMEQLSARQKEVIYLKYYRKLSYEEIGEAMQINYQSIRNLLHNALKILKDFTPLVRIIAGLIILLHLF